MIDSPKLTPRQQEILELIQNTIANTGAPPTRAEIANVLGFKSANAAEETSRPWPAKARSNWSAAPPAAFASKAAHAAVCAPPPICSASPSLVWDN